MDADCFEKSAEKTSKISVHLRPDFKSVRVSRPEHKSTMGMKRQRAFMLI
jgi:hypothetical protein